MKWVGLVLVPLLYSSVAMNAQTAWAQGKAAAPAAVQPGTPPPGLSARRPATTPTDLLPGLRSRIPATTQHAMPDNLLNHRQGSARAAVAPEVSNTPRPKSPTRPFKAGPKGPPGMGGDDAGSATPIPSLPYSDSGNTCSLHDDYTPPCGAPGGPEAVYVYAPQDSGCIRLSLCGSSYDTELYIAQDSTANIIACNDDFCGLASDLEGIPVAPGHVYYIFVDGYGGSCGDYQFHVESCPGPPGPVTCSFDARPEGEPVCADGYVDNFDGGCNSSPEAFIDLQCSTDTIKVCGTYGTYLYQGSQYRDTDWYRMSFSNSTTIHYCVTGQYATSIAVLDGNQGCGGAFTLANATGNPGQTVCLDLPLSGGTYYLVVVPADFSGVPCGSNYYMTVHADSCPPPPPPLTCPPNAMQEGEPVCQDNYVDTYDGGCNSPTPVFVDIPCAPGTTEVCGTYGTYLYQGSQYRDTDWYQIMVNRTTNIQYSVDGEYPTAIGVLDGRFGCGGINELCFTSGAARQVISCNVTVTPGTYWLFVATSEYSGRPCGGRYVISVTRDSCPEPFVLACPPGAMPEGEPVCHTDYVDNYDAGCNSDPPTFINPYGGGTGNIDCVAGTVQVCGTYGTYLNQGAQYRDTDWYQVVAHGPTHLRYCVVGEAATTIYLLNGSSGCGGLSIVCNSSGGPGDSLCCDVNVGGGTYWLFVAPSDFSGVACGSRYVMSVTQDSCPGPFRVQCPPNATLEGEPVCSDAYVDQTNGGCNSNPPVFTDTPCSEDPIQICGTYGTYRFQGFDFRDTDWYRINLSQPQHVRFCVVGEAPTVIHILRGSTSCSSITSECTNFGGAGDSICCETDLPGGVHWLFVAPSTFSGIACGSRYVITLVGAHCTGPTPVNMAMGTLNARAETGLIELKWQAFAAMPTEFRVMRTLSEQDGYQVLSDAIPSAGGHEFRFTDRNIQPATEYFYRIDYRQTGDWVAASSTRITSPAGALAIHRIVPNPSTGVTRIDYELPRAANTRLEIFNVGGQRVRVLVSGQVAAGGTASVTWDGRNDRGQRASMGVYFVRLTMDHRTVSHRLMLTR